MRNLLVLILFANLFLLACSKSRAPLMQAPPQKFEELNLAAGETKSIKPPKVNMIIVEDNSGSMIGHQQTLRSNVNAFANTFFDNPRIEYKIGVVPVYDRRYLDGETGVCRDPKTPRKMNKFGELIALKDRSGNILPDSAPFITRDTPDAKEVLKSTVALGVQCGPEAEESFSPVLEIIENKELNAGWNAGFYDKDAYLVLIFLTDADDVTPGVTASSFYRRLVEAKGGDEKARDKILIATALSNPAKRSEFCKSDGNGPVYKFPDLISISRAFHADLCSSNFGQAFAIFGKSLADKIARQRIGLNFLPDMSYRVTYGLPGTPEEQRQPIPEGPNGVTFFPETREFELSPNLPIQRIDGGEIFIHATPAELRNVNNGRLKTL